MFPHVHTLLRGATNWLGKDNINKPSVQQLRGHGKCNNECFMICKLRVIIYIRHFCLNAC